MTLHHGALYTVSLNSRTCSGAKGVRYGTPKLRSAHRCMPTKHATTKMPKKTEERRGQHVGDAKNARARIEAVGRNGKRSDGGAGDDDDHSGRRQAGVDGLIAQHQSADDGQGRADDAGQPDARLTQHLEDKQHDDGFERGGKGDAFLDAAMLWSNAWGSISAW